LYCFSTITNTYVLFISRTIAGFGTGKETLKFFFSKTQSFICIGVLSVTRAYVASQTTKEERTKYIGYVSGTQFVGFAVTPSKNNLHK
jgi:MFS family permease